MFRALHPHTLSHCGLVTPYDASDFGQHWSMQWLVAGQLQVITWTDVELPSRSSATHSEVQCQLEYIKYQSPSCVQIYTFEVTATPPDDNDFRRFDMYINFVHRVEFVSRRLIKKNMVSFVVSFAFLNDIVWSNGPYSKSSVAKGTDKFRPIVAVCTGPADGCNRYIIKGPVYISNENI